MENDGEENGGYSIRRGRGVRKTSNHFRVLILSESGHGQLENNAKEMLTIINHLTSTTSSSIVYFRCCLSHSRRYASSTTATVPIPLATPATTMHAWAVQSYKTPLVQMEIPVPKLKRDDHVLLRVMAASVNPIDLRICEGYGHELLTLRARMGWSESDGIPDPRRVVAALTRHTTSPNAQECFPLVPGRDCSAQVIEIGPRVEGIEIGDQVIAVIPPECQGTHADYVTAPAYAIAPKPSALKHTEAASLPYVVCTAWAALVTTARIQPKSASHVRVLIHGGAGGVGTAAIQMLKCWGAKRIVATCSGEKLELVEQLGARAVDYQSADAKEQLIELGPFEVVLNCVDSELATWSSAELLGTWRNCVSVTLNSSLLADTDRYGLAMGAASFGSKLLCNNISGPMSKGQLTLPAFFSPSSECLLWLSRMAQEGRIRPVIDEVFPFSELPKAFEKVSRMRARGKTVVDFCQ